VTTQKGIRYAIHPIHRWYRVDHLLHLGLQARLIVKQFYVDRMQSRINHYRKIQVHSYTRRGLHEGLSRHINSKGRWNVGWFC
jgi:hypothetical protein